MTKDVRDIDILLVDDSVGDIELALEAFAEAQMENKVHVAHDGLEALEFLRQEGKHVDAKRPDIILLDLNMPRMDGRETLKAIKSDPKLMSIPVIILTTSDSEADVLITYGLHANCYIKKPVNFATFISVVQKIEDFWMNVARIPKQDS